MKITKLIVRNFRRLEDVSIDIEEKETVFVGPNNSGKTSATAILRCFLGGKDFLIHDLCVSKIAELNDVVKDPDKNPIPSIELDIWFSINTDEIEFGRAFRLLPKLADFEKVGIRLKYSAADLDSLLAEYLRAYPETAEAGKRKTLAQFLAIDTNFKRNFEISYFSLEDTGGTIVEHELGSADGKSLVNNLIRVDFIDAQRNITDDDSNRSNKLSAAFAEFYRKNLDEPLVAEQAYAVIDENNRKLTEHYANQFSELKKVIRGFGVPAVNDRELKLVSSLSPEAALKGNTDLLYVDTKLDHELPELYNGLGFKNLIYMAIQAWHFHLQWLRTSDNRPLCQIISIEEPEAHLHAQVQQTFITQIWQIIEESSKIAGENPPMPQILVTTHSSHILDTADFSKIRYFRRCRSVNETDSTNQVLNATDVRSLRMFQPNAFQIGTKLITEAQALEFLRRYLRLTHCDLFFADGVILVEGAVEKLLLPEMINMSAPKLNSTFLTVLEVGGAYAHRFEGLLEFLGIPYLVITDLDSVEAVGHHKKCKANSVGALTSNESLKHFFGITTVAELMAFSVDQKQNIAKDRFVTFQADVPVIDGENILQMRPRTLEEAFYYENFSLVRSGEISIDKALPNDLNMAYDNIYEYVVSSNFKKTDFAMDVLSGAQDWHVPQYISVGLQWLEQRLSPRPPTIEQ